MNTRSQTFDLTVEYHQVDEAVASIFHSVLLHRTFGKFHYEKEGGISAGTLGYSDIDCDYIDFTYVCCASLNLDTNLKKGISIFSDVLRERNGPKSGLISLEFFQKKRSVWPFPSECIPWEVWNVQVEIVKITNEYERQLYREKVGELLADKVLCIAETMNRQDYVPKLPSEQDLDLIFDTSYNDCQPYLYKIVYMSGPAATSLSSAVKKLFKDSLSH